MAKYAVTSNVYVDSLKDHQKITFSGIQESNPNFNISADGVLGFGPYF